MSSPKPMRRSLDDDGHVCRRRVLNDQSSRMRRSFDDDGHVCRLSDVWRMRRSFDDDDLDSLLIHLPQEGR